MDDFRYAIGRKIKFLAQDKIDVKHGKFVFFVQFVKTILDAHVPFRAIRRFFVHNVVIFVIRAIAPRNAKIQHFSDVRT